MNYVEAIRTAKQWTNNINPQDEGWRGVMAMLVQRIKILETTNAGLHDIVKQKMIEIERLSLDLGIKEQDFVLYEPRKMPE